MLAGFERRRVPGGKRGAEYYIRPAMDSGTGLVFEIVRASVAVDFGARGMVFFSCDQAVALGMHGRSAGGGFKFELFFGCVLGSWSARHYNRDEFFCAGGTVGRGRIELLVAGGIGWPGGGNGGK